MWYDSTQPIAYICEHILKYDIGEDKKKRQAQLLMD